MAGTPLESQPELYCTLLAGFDSATVSDEGVVTAEAPGKVIVQVACAALGNSVNLFTPAGIPINAVTAEQSIEVTEGYVKPDFYFVLTSPSERNYTITQHPETNSTWDEEVTYTLGPTNIAGGPEVLGTITGSCTLNFSSASQNFVLQGTCASSGTYHVIFTTWNSGNVSNPQFAYPVTSSRGLRDGSSGTSNSGQPYVD